MSKAASIQKIIKIEKHPNADTLEICSILGWKCIVKMGQFKEGDLVIYVEPDSLVPKLEKYSFLKHIKRDEKGEEYYFIKPIKLRKVESIGLVLPLNTLELIPYEDHFGAKTKMTNCEGETLFLDLEEGVEVSNLLGIKHYEKPIPITMVAQVKGNFPYFLIKTDEERIQNIPEILEELKDQPYYISEKVDGTSATYYYKDGIFGVCSRNLELKEDENNIYWKMAKKYNLNEILKEYFIKNGYELCIQGEIYGQSLQGNPLQIEGQELAIFNIYNITTKSYFIYEALIHFCLKNNLKTVLIIEKSEPPFKLFNYTLDELIEKAKGLYSGTNNKREGIVVRSLDKNISFKVINNEYEE